jgi:hypothetical protein
MEIFLKKITPEERAARIAKEKIRSAEERKAKLAIKAMTADIKAFAASLPGEWTCDASPQRQLDEMTVGFYRILSKHRSSTE